MKSSVTKPAAAVEQCQVKSRKRIFHLFLENKYEPNMCILVNTNKITAPRNENNKNLERRF